MARLWTYRSVVDHGVGMQKCCLIEVDAWWALYNFLVPCNKTKEWVREVLAAVLLEQWRLRPMELEGVGNPSCVPSKVWFSGQMVQLNVCDFSQSPCWLLLLGRGAPGEHCLESSWVMLSTDLFALWSRNGERGEQWTYPPWCYRGGYVESSCIRTHKMCSTKSES